MANLPTKDELLAQLNGIYDAARLKGEDVDSMPPPGVLLAQLLGMSTEEEVYDSVDPNQAKALDVFQRALSGTVERLSGVPFLPAELSTATNGRVVMQRSLSLPGNCTVLVHYTNLAAIHHPTVSRAAERCIRGIAAHAPGLVVRLLPTTTDAEQQYEEPSQPAPAVAAPLDSDTDSGTDSDEGEEPETTKSSSWLPYVAAGVAVGMAATLMSAEGDGEEDEAPLSAAAAAAAAAAGAP